MPPSFSAEIEQDFRMEGNALTKADMLRLPLEERPFHVVAFVDRLDDPAIRADETRLMVVWFNNTISPKLFELPAQVVNEFQQKEPSFQQQWQFKLEGSELELTITRWIQ